MVISKAMVAQIFTDLFIKGVKANELDFLVTPVGFGPTISWMRTKCPRPLDDGAVSKLYQIDILCLCYKIITETNLVLVLFGKSKFIFILFATHSLCKYK